MYLLLRNNKVIDYCASGYCYVGNTVACNDKGCSFEDATIVYTEKTLPSDIDGACYEYIHGEFIRVSEGHYTKSETDNAIYNAVYDVLNTEV